MGNKKGYVDLKQSQSAVLIVPKSFYGIGDMEITLEYRSKMKKGVPFIIGSAWVRKKGQDLKYRFYRFRIPAAELEKDSYRGSLFFHLSDNENYLRRLEYIYGMVCESDFENEL